jgi:hypothetical protein
MVTFGEPYPASLCEPQALYSEAPVATAGGAFAHVANWRDVVALSLPASSWFYLALPTQAARRRQWRVAHVHACPLSSSLALSQKTNWRGEGVTRPDSASDLWMLPQRSSFRGKAMSLSSQESRAGAPVRRGVRSALPTRRPHATPLEVNSRSEFYEQVSSTRGGGPRQVRPATEHAEPGGNHGVPKLPQRNYCGRILLHVV